MSRVMKESVEVQPQTPEGIKSENKMVRRVGCAGAVIGAVIATIVVVATHNASNFGAWLGGELGGLGGGFVFGASMAREAIPVRRSAK